LPLRGGKEVLKGEREEGTSRFPLRGKRVEGTSLCPLRGKREEGTSRSPLGRGKFPLPSYLLEGLSYEKPVALLGHQGQAKSVEEGCTRHRKIVRKLSKKTRF